MRFSNTLLQYVFFFTGGFLFCLIVERDLVMDFSLDHFQMSQAKLNAVSPTFFTLAFYTHTCVCNNYFLRVYYLTQNKKKKKKHTPFVCSLFALHTKRNFHCVFTCSLNSSLYLLIAKNTEKNHNKIKICARHRHTKKKHSKNEKHCFLVSFGFFRSPKCLVYYLLNCRFIVVLFCYLFPCFQPFFFLHFSLLK